MAVASLRNSQNFVTMYSMMPSCSGSSLAESQYCIRGQRQGALDLQMFLTCNFDIHAKVMQTKNHFSLDSVRQSE